MRTILQPGARRRALRYASLAAVPLAAAGMVELTGCVTETRPERAGQTQQAYCVGERSYLAPTELGCNDNLWPGGVIPYVFDFTMPSDTQQKILYLMSEFQNATYNVIQFVPRTSEAHYVDFFYPSDNSRPGCVGTVTGRDQPVVVSNLGGCLFPPSLIDFTHPPNAVQEMGHVVGLANEVNRTDRDGYLVMAPPLPGSYGTTCDPSDAIAHDDETFSLCSVKRPFTYGGTGVPDYAYRGVGPYDIGSVMQTGGASATTLGFQINGSPIVVQDYVTVSYVSPACGAIPTGDRSFSRRGITDVLPGPPCASDVIQTGHYMGMFDASELVELYRMESGWAPFRLLGSQPTKFAPPVVTLAAGVLPVGAPAVASLGTSPTSGTPLVVMLSRGSDGKIYERRAASAHFAPAWSALPGTVDSDAAAVSWTQSEARIDVVAIVGGNVVKQAYYGGAWEGFWSSLGAPAPGVDATSAPTIASWGTNHLDVFVRGNDGYVWQKTWNGGWTSWSRPKATSLGLVEAGTHPSAVSWDANRIDVVIRAQDESVRTLTWSAGAWGTDWIQIGDHWTSGIGSPAIAGWGPGRLDVFVQGAGLDTNLWLLQIACTTAPCTAPAQWMPSFVGLGGILAGEPAASSPRNTGVHRIDVVAHIYESNVNTKNVWHKWWPWDSWPASAQSRKADFDGDHRTDMSVWRPSSAKWWVRDSTTQTIQTSVTIGQSGDVPVPGDYDGDQLADMAVYRPSSGDWWVRSTATGVVAPGVTIGQSGDIPVPGDYDGDGKTDIAVFRPSTGAWIVRSSSTLAILPPFFLGQSGDTPAPADYDGDGKVDPAVFRASTGTWLIFSSATGTFQPGVVFGQNGDQPVPADYDGDGQADMAVWRPSSGKWWFRSSIDGTTPSGVAFGQNGDVPVPGDYDGDGMSDMAVWRPATAAWFVRYTATGSVPPSVTIGQSGDVPVVANAAASTHR